MAAGPSAAQGIPELLARFRARSGRPAFPPGLSQAASCPSPSAASLPLTRVAAAASPRVLPSSSAAAAGESFGANTAGGSSLSPGALRLLHSCSVRQFLWPSGLRPRRPLRFIGPGYVCLYAGNRGVAKEVMKLGSIPWAAAFDWKHGSGQASLPYALPSALQSPHLCVQVSTPPPFPFCRLPWP